MTYIKKGKEFLPLRATHFNAQSLRNKFTELKHFVATNDFDIICVTETWFDDDVSESEYTPDGYTPFYTHRDLSFYEPGTYTEESRGGVLLLIRSSLHPTPADITAPAEIKWVNIKPHDKITVLIGVAYHPDLGGPKNLEVICNSIREIDNDNILLVGDFNLRDINWETWEASTAPSKQFLETLEENDLTQLVDKPTRGNNIIDLVITGLNSIVDNVTVEEPFSTSDH